MSERSDKFVEQWVSRNVHNIPGLEDYTDHVAELAEQLGADAEAAGIEEDELAETVGDPIDFLTNAYEQIQDAALFFHESD